MLLNLFFPLQLFKIVLYLLLDDYYIMYLGV